MFYDVIIAGSGIAGLYSALSLDKRISVLLLAKKELPLSNTSLAQGGVAAVLDLLNDNFQLHIDDTMAAGGGTNSLEAVKVLVEEGPDNITKLLSLGVDLDKKPDGSLSLTLEAAHSRRRITHHKDTTGFEISSKLILAAKSRENITIIENATLYTLERNDTGFCAGILCGKELLCATSRFFIMATGGIGQAFKYSTNSTISTGDGIMLSKKLGANVKGLSLVQFHPTAFAGNSDQQRFLISESVRGEGALLLNCLNEHFMPNYDKRAELAPRDVVSQCIMREVQRTGSEAFYLDITARGADYIKDRFPGIYMACLKSGIDITTQKIPVFPCQHYLMGGIDVDTYARTSVEGLYAIGECSHTGVHGNNRLASNSLLEGLVFSKRAADDIMGKTGFGSTGCNANFSLTGSLEAPKELRSEIQNIMQESFFVLPNKQAAILHLPRINEISTLLENSEYADSTELLELRSLSFIVKTILMEVTK